ncbi:MAG: YkvA family protein [Anaerolineae bacterium]
MPQKLKTAMELISREIDVYRKVLLHRHTPWYAKVVLGLAIAYFVSPIDLIPDPIPVLGQLDDLLIVPGLVWLALKLIPAEVVEQCRVEVLARD